MLKRKRVLAAKAETTVGTAIALSATDAAMNIMDAMIQPEITMTDRMQQGDFGRLPGTPEGHQGKATFKTELHGDGAAGVPLWASTFLPACGWVDSTGTFSPVASPPGSDGVKTLTISSYQDGIIKTIRGAMGSFKVTIPSGKIGFIEWDFTGIWVDPVDGAMLTPTYPTQIPLRGANASMTVASWAPCIESITLESGNTVVMRECQKNESGFISALVSDRVPKGQLNPEATLVATEDTYGDWLDSTEKAFSYAMTDSTDTITFSSSKWQAISPQESDRGGNVTDDIQFQFNNDDFDIEFS